MISIKRILTIIKISIFFFYMKKITSIVIACVAFLILTPINVIAQIPTPTVAYTQNNTTQQSTNTEDHTVMYIIIGLIVVFAGRGFFTRLGNSSYGNTFKNS